jgi:hypothetical protein
LDSAGANQQFVHGVFGPEGSLRYLCARNGRADAVGDSLHRCVDGRQGFGARLNRQVGEIDVHGQAGHVTDEQIDRRAAFERKACFLRDGRENADQQLDLSAIDLTERQRDPPER